MELPTLTGKLPKEIVSIWRIKAFIFPLIILILLIVNFIIFEFPIWLLASGIAVIIFILVFSLIIAKLRWKRFSYQVQENEIEIERGAIFRRRILVPMIRIQHVETRQGPLLRKNNLHLLTIFTAASVHEIDALYSEEADRLRYQILELVKVAKEDV